MITLTIDRAIVEQALKAMEKATRFMSDSDYRSLNQAIDDFRAALAQQAEAANDKLLSAAGLALEALQKERQFAGNAGRAFSMLSVRAIEELQGAFRELHAQQAESPCACWPGRMCSRQAQCAADVRAQQAEPVEPVGQLAELQAMLRAEVDRLIAAGIQPQRKPLTDEEILDAVGWGRAEMYMKLTPNFPVDEAKKETLKNARAVERAHGIGDDDAKV